ncbi:MAG: phage holin family protein [Capsulimonadaceae bacterium]
MIQLLARWAISAVALYITVLLAQHFNLHIGLAPGLSGVIATVEAVAVLAVVNAVIRPIVKLLTLPLTCLTFGLFSFVINALMFWIVGQVVHGFVVKGFVAPLFASIVMSIVSGILSFFLISGDEKERKRR